MKIFFTRFAAPFLVAAFLWLGFASAAHAAARFAVCSVTCTWDGSSTTMWSATSGGATGASVPGSGDTVTFDASTCVGGVTCTITVNTNFSIQTITLSACTASTAGCILDFSVNNNSPTLGAWTNVGSGTRTVHMGSGTFTITNGTGQVWSQNGATNLTFDAGTSTILFSATATGSRSLLFGTFTNYNVTVSNPVVNSWPISLTNGGSPTFNNLTLTNVQNFSWSSATTITVSGIFSFSGTSSKPGILSANGISGTLSLANATVLSWLVVQNITRSGAGALTVNNAVDAGGNSSITLNPATVSNSARCIGC